MSKKVTIDLDDTKTYSGLPAPHDWHIEDRLGDGLKWRRLVGEAISVIETIAIKEDGCRWLHVSVAKPSPKKMPTYADVQTARRFFVGEHRECYHIFPTQERYVDFYPVLHLYCNLDKPEGVLPRMEGRLTPGMLAHLDIPDDMKDKIKPGELSV